MRCHGALNEVGRATARVQPPQACHNVLKHVTICAGRNAPFLVGCPSDRQDHRQSHTPIGCPRLSPQDLVSSLRVPPPAPPPPRTRPSRNRGQQCDVPGEPTRTTVTTTTLCNNRNNRTSYHSRRLGNPVMGLETTRDAWWVGIWAMQNQASHVPYHGPCQEPANYCLTVIPRPVCKAW